jgi:alginate production protein
MFYHHYREVTASAGGASHLGDGLDLVIGYRPARGIEIDAAIGWFKRGTSATATQSGVTARIELEYYF